MEAGNGSAVTTPTEPPASLGEILDTERRLFWRRRRCSRTGGCIHGRCLLVHHGRRVRVQRVYGRCLRFRHGWRLCVHRVIWPASPYLWPAFACRPKSARDAASKTKSSGHTNGETKPRQLAATSTGEYRLAVGASPSFSTRSVQHVPAQLVLCSSNKSTH